jgi:hypothetical protein
MILITWPFTIWGLDLVAKLPIASRGFNHLFVPIDKFTNRIEAKLVTMVYTKNAIEFIKETIHRYVVVNTIIIDNGTQFTGCEFMGFCND